MILKRIIRLTGWFVFLFLVSDCENKINDNINNSGDWGIFRGDPALSASADVSLPEQPALLWSFNSDVNTKSSPVVYNRIAYWSDKRGRIYGVNINGEQVFDYDLETAVNATPMIFDSVFYIGRIDGYLTAISLETGNLLWDFETFGQIAASPNRINFDDKEAIVVGSYDNFVYCIDSKNGKAINRYESGYYVNGAVAQCNNFIVFGGCDGWIRVIDCISGIQTDSLDVGNFIPASPAIHKNVCYIADYSGNIYEIVLNNGKIVSSRKIIESQDNSRSFVSVPAVSDKMVYMVSDDRHVYAINRKEDTMAWKYLLKGATGESSPVICKDKLLVCTKTGMVSILDSKTGDLLWEYDTGEQIIASPAVIKGFFYILTQKGRLFCFGNPTSS